MMMLLLVLLTWLHTAATLQTNQPAPVEQLQVELGMYTGNCLWGRSLPMKLVVLLDVSCAKMPGPLKVIAVK